MVRPLPEGGFPTRLGLAELEITVRGTSWVRSMTSWVSGSGTGGAGAGCKKVSSEEHMRSRELRLLGAEDSIEAGPGTMRAGSEFAGLAGRAAGLGDSPGTERPGPKALLEEDTGGFGRLGLRVRGGRPVLSALSELVLRVC